MIGTHRPKRTNQTRGASTAPVQLKGRTSSSAPGIASARSPASAKVAKGRNAPEARGVGRSTVGVGEKVASGHCGISRRRLTPRGYVEAEPYAVPACVHVRATRSFGFGLEGPSIARHIAGTDGHLTLPPDNEAPILGSKPRHFRRGCVFFSSRAAAGLSRQRRQSAPR